MEVGRSFYPGGWRNKTRPSSPKVILRVIPEDVGLDIAKCAPKEEKPTDPSRAKRSQASSTKPPGNDELPSAALSSQEGKAMEANRALDPQAQHLKPLQGVWECVAKAADHEGKKSVTIDWTLNSARAVVRNAKALFGVKIAKLLKDVAGLSLPEPLPMSDVNLTELFGKKQKMRYQSKIDAEKLLTLAGAELAPSQPEAFKVLLLALCCGLRKREIDCLLWKSG